MGISRVRLKALFSDLCYDFHTIIFVLSIIKDKETLPQPIFIQDFDRIRYEPFLYTFVFLINAFSISRAKSTSSSRL